MQHTRAGSNQPYCSTPGALQPREAAHVQYGRSSSSSSSSITTVTTTITTTMRCSHLACTAKQQAGNGTLDVILPLDLGGNTGGNLQWVMQSDGTSECRVDATVSCQ